MILDWDVVQIKGALLETWLPTIFERLQQLATTCGARFGTSGAWMKTRTQEQYSFNRHNVAAGPQTPLSRNLRRWGKTSAQSPHLAMCIAVTSNILRMPTTKQSLTSKNREITSSSRSRIFGLEIGTAEREDDLLDTFCYGIAISLGNSEGY